MAALRTGKPEVTDREPGSVSRARQGFRPP
jgi:hypothetical protein